MAQEKYIPLVGTTIALTDEKGPMKPCMYCGCCSGKVTGPTEVHNAGIRCEGCGRHIGWLSARHLDAMLAQKKGAA